MIAGIFHEGSGLGDQLFRYITVRTLAEKKGLEWGMINYEGFKGSFFTSFYGGKNTDTTDFIHHFNEKEVRQNGVDIRSYDPEINFVEDNTIIDGSFEDFKYWGDNLSQINQWLWTESLWEGVSIKGKVTDDTCLIGFRGGEYATVPELFLPKTYYEEAMKSLPASIQKYEVHTDDPGMAKTFFKEEKFLIIDNMQISHSKHTNMGLNWRSARNAKYAVIPNSAFFILPRLLKHHEDPTAVTIAPRYHAGRNVKQWRRPACWYPSFTYV